LAITRDLKRPFLVVATIAFPLNYGSTALRASTLHGYTLADVPTDDPSFPALAVAVMAKNATNASVKQHKRFFELMATLFPTRFHLCA
jgi:hypothetical protein